MHGPYIFSHICFCFSAFSRQQLSKVNFESPPISPVAPASAVKCKTPREGGQKSSSSILSNFFVKKHRTPPSKVTQHEVQRGHARDAQTLYPNDSDLDYGKAHVSVVVKEEPIDVEDTSTRGLTSVKSEDTASHSRSLGSEMAHSSSPSKDVKPIIKGEASSAQGLKQCITLTFSLLFNTFAPIKPLKPKWKLK